MTSTSVAYEILKEVLQAEGKWKQMAVHIRMKRWKVLEMVNAWVRGIFQLLPAPEESLPLSRISNPPLWATTSINALFLKAHLLSSPAWSLAFVFASLGWLFPLSAPLCASP